MNRPVIADDVLCNDPSKKVKWVESMTGHEFNLSLLDLKNAEYRLGILLAMVGYCSINDFLDIMADYDKNQHEETADGMDIGWSLWMFDPFGGAVVDFMDIFIHQMITLDDNRQIFTISYTFEPTDEFMEED